MNLVVQSPPSWPWPLLVHSDFVEAFKHEVLNADICRHLVAVTKMMVFSAGDSSSLVVEVLPCVPPGHSTGPSWPPHHPCAPHHAAS